MSSGQTTSDGGAPAAPDDELGVYARVQRDHAREEEAATAKRVFFLSAFFDGTRGARAGFREVAGILNTIRAPLFVSLLGFLAFAVPGQVREIYRLFAEDFSFEAGFSDNNIRFFSFFVMLHLTGYSLWFIARILTLTDKTALASLAQWDADGFAARWGPRIIGALPAFGAAWGMFVAESTRVGDLRTPGLYGAAGLAFLLGCLRIWLSWRRTHVDRDCYASLRATWFRTDVRATLTALLIAVFAFLMTQPIVFTQLVGALSIFCFFMIALVFGWAQLTYIYDRYALPLLTVLVGAALAFAMLDLNDNHFARTIEPSAAEQRADAAMVQQLDIDLGLGPIVPLTVENAFEDWLDARADRAAFEAVDKPYPVFVVAAQGGGLYAAYQTAMYLAKIQDACPSFASHVFGISGVSGGAVGAATFTALALEHAQNQPLPPASDPSVSAEVAALTGIDPALCGATPLDAAGKPVSFAAKTDAMLRQDFLSPLISGMLFGDFTARFSPVPIPAFDRARALERAFELSWRAALDTDTPPNGAGPSGARPAGAAALSFTSSGFMGLRDYDPRLENNPLERGILEYWREDGAAPALFLNATESETGRRMVFSPIQDLGQELRSYAIAVQPRPDGVTPDMRLSTAAMVSARFPYVTPAASVPLRPIENADGTFPKLRLVDGGYFENSGIDTAMDVVDSLNELQRKRRFEAREKGLEAKNEFVVRLIVFDLTEDEFRNPSYAFGEALSPVKAILNARVSRSALAQSRARRSLQSTCRYVKLGGPTPPGARDDDPVNRLCLPSEMAASRVWSVSLNDYEYDFQLGWILSRVTLDSVERQLGDPRECRPDPTVFGEFGETVPLGTTDAQQLDDAVRRHNSCIGMFVTNMLRRQ